MCLILRDFIFNSFSCGAQAAGAEKVEAADNMYKVNQELSSDSQKFRLDFYFQATSEGEALLSSYFLLSIVGTSF